MANLLIKKYKRDNLREKTRARKARLEPSLSVPAKVLIGLIILAAVLGLSPRASAFEVPENDSWYYQSDEQGYNYWLPDKVQHSWGSALLNELYKQLDLPAKKVTTPMVTLAAGFVWEVWQDGKGVGFSERDLVADALGIVTSEFSSKNLIFYMNYSTDNRVIMFNVIHSF